MRWGAAEPKSNKAVMLPLPKADTDTPWSEDEIRQLKALRAEELSPRLISAKLHRTVRSVNSQLAVLRGKS